VDVHDAHWKRTHHDRGQQAVEARKHDEFDPAFPQDFHDASVERFARLEIVLTQDHGVQAMFAGAFSPTSGRDIAEYDTDLGV
jgi:hypothetical protein